MTAEEMTYLLIAVIGSIVGIVGLIFAFSNWKRGETDDVEQFARWQGRVDGKLDAILGIDKRVNNLEENMINVRNDIALVERTAKKAHDRIDKLEDKE